jgi:hypothetical protein
MLHPNQFIVNEAWIAFQLNTAPIRTETDGAFHCFALMDAASCFILASEMIAASQQEPSQLEFRRLLKSGSKHNNALPRTLFVPREWSAEVITREAERQGIEVVRVPERELVIFVGEAQQGFREWFGQGFERGADST